MSQNFSAEFAMTLDRYYNYRIKEVFIAEERDRDNIMVRTAVKRQTLL